MDYEILKAELRDDPLEIGYAEMADQQAADALNAPTQTVPIHRRVNERDVLAEWGNPAEAEAFLQKLEAVSSTNAVVKRVLRWFTPNQEGIDAGHPATHAMIDSLVGVASITAEEVVKFKSMAVQQVSRASVLGLGTVGDGHVKSAREMN